LKKSEIEAEKRGLYIRKRLWKGWTLMCGEAGRIAEEIRNAIA